VTDEVLRKKAMLLLKRERELLALRQRLGWTASWLALAERTAALVHQGCEADVVASWPGLVVSELKYQQVLLARITPGGLEVLGAGGACAALAGTSLGEPVDYALTSPGLCNRLSERPPGLPEGLARVMWCPIVVGDESWLAVAGFDERTHAFHPPFEAEDLAYFRTACRQLEALASQLKAIARLNVVNDALDHALRRAEVAVEVKGEFLAMMSHEIRTPMNGVLGMTEVLEQSALSDEQRASLRVLRQSGEAMLTLLNDILDLSKIEAGKLELERRDFNLRDELRATAELFRQLVVAKGLAFELDLDEALPQAVTGDSARLRQILSNLLSNAVKFTQRGSVRLSCRAGAQVDGKVRLAFSVTDTGEGIPAARRDRLFQAFSQADSSITRRFGGTGLGLAICAQLCAKMGGRITLESEPGRGTRCDLSVELPVVEVPLPPTASAECCARRFPGLRVLVAEDNPINQLVVKRLLGTCGIEPELAVNGQEAVELATRIPFDLILMDMQMPVMDGLEATSLIRLMPLSRQPRIVALTANAFESDRTMCLRAQMDDFVAKPLRLTVLQALLEAVPPQPSP